MTSPFTISYSCPRHEESFHINGRICMGTDCSGSMGFSIHRPDGFMFSEFHLTLDKVAEELKCIVRHVEYIDAYGNDLTWKVPHVVVLEKNGWILSLRCDNYKPIVWEIEKLKHNKKSKHAKNIIRETVLTEVST